MKTFIADIFPKLKRFSQALDNITILMNQYWVVIDANIDSKTVYIFRNNGVLLISTNGLVEKAKWEYLGNQYLLIETDEESLLFKQGFIDENILALKIDSKNEYAVFVNESKTNTELNSIDNVTTFLINTYEVKDDFSTLDLTSPQKYDVIQKVSDKQSFNKLNAFVVVSIFILFTAFILYIVNVS